MRRPRRIIFNGLSAISALLLFAVALLKVCALVHHSVDPWPLPQIVEGDIIEGMSEPEQLPRCYGLYSARDALWVEQYQPISPPLRGPAPRLYQQMRTGDSVWWKGSLNPAAKAFRAQYPDFRMVWEHGPVYCYDHFVEHRKVGVKIDSYMLITGRERVWCIEYWPIEIATAILPAIWLLGWIKRKWRMARARKGYCSICGYDLRGSPGRCPLSLYTSGTLE